MATKGKWAQGITPRHFAWVIKDKLAISERPGGYGANHRKVRRQEEIIWVREQGFTKVVSLIGSPHNLHNYDELGVHWAHCPLQPQDDVAKVLGALYPQLTALMAGAGKVLVHGESLDDRICGAVAGYLLWSGLLPDGPRTITAMEQLASRQLGPEGRELVAIAQRLRDGES
ncbi:MAG: hypothetical protein JJE52_06010 [Acidimicrobiia bacterium]|nr:hypothetical protein [Acidimicrobiia bacterium]